MKRWHKIALISIVSIVLAMALELFYYNYRSLVYSDNAAISLNSSADHFQIVGLDKTDSGYAIQNTASSISVNVENQYFDKLIVKYRASNSMNLTATVQSYDGAGRPTEFQVFDVLDYRLSTSVTNINSHLSKLTLSLDSTDIEITDIVLTRELSITWTRVLFFILLFFVIQAFIFFRSSMFLKPENSFLLIALSAGILLLVLMPLKHPVVWDDDHHFHRSYSISFGRSVEWTEAARMFNDRNAPATNTYEEQILSARYMNSIHDYSEPIAVDPGRRFIPYQLRSYVPIASGLFIARLFGTSFFTFQLLGRAANFLFYVLICFLAIKNIPYGKKILSVIALMPTPLFVASNFSYDPFIISLAYLGFAIFVKEFSNSSKKLSALNLVIIVASFIFASYSKAVYVPLLLVTLLFGTNKFSSKKQMYVVKASVVILFVLMLATFVLPAVSESSIGGDTRGGDTSVARQLSYIFSEPITYTRLLLSSIWFSLGEYILGLSPLMNFAYLGVIAGNASYAATINLLFVALTDTQRNDKLQIMDRKQKLFILILLFSSVCLIWTALYLSFTPVGINQINGVQARYYLPLLLPFIFVLRPKNIISEIDRSKYHTFVMLMSTFVIFSAIYYNILKPFNF